MEADVRDRVLSASCSRRAPPPRCPGSRRSPSVNRLRSVGDDAPHVARGCRSTAMLRGAKRQSAYGNCPALDRRRRVDSLQWRSVGLCHNCPRGRELGRNRLDHDGCGEPYAGLRPSIGLVHAAITLRQSRVLRACSLGRSVQRIRVVDDGSADSRRLRFGVALGSRADLRDRAFDHRVRPLSFRHGKTLARLRGCSLSASDPAVQLHDRGQHQFCGRYRAGACTVVGRCCRCGPRRHSQSLADRYTDRQPAARGVRRRCFDHALASRRSCSAPPCCARGWKYPAVCRWRYRLRES